MFTATDCAGLWNIEDPKDPISVKSPSGYIITLGDTLVTWSSKFQTEIATSTMHAEYVALSPGMSKLVPIQNTLGHICQVFNVPRNDNMKNIKVLEDNEGAMKLAQAPIKQVTPHSKHFGIKYHWFHEKLGKFIISICCVDTSLQKADIFTKGLGKSEFQKKCKLLMV